MSEITNELSDNELDQKAIEIGKILNGISIKEVDRIILRFQVYLRYNSIVSFVE